MRNVVVLLYWLWAVSCGEQWEDLLPSIAVFVSEGLPFFVSEPDLWTANKSFAVLAGQGCEKLYPVTLNPFRCPLSCVATTQQWGLTVPALPNAFLLGCGVEPPPAEPPGPAGTAPAPSHHDGDDDDDEDDDEDGSGGGDDDGVDDDDADADADDGDGHTDDDADHGGDAEEKLK